MNLSFLGPFHPQIVHTPIALIIFSAFFAVIGRITDREWLKKAALVMLVLQSGCRMVSQGRNVDGVRYFQQGQYPVAIQRFDAALTIDPKTFISIRIEYDHSGRPVRVETMEVCGTLFDVCFERHEVVVNKRSSLVIAVRLGFQPSTCASRRRGAKVDEQWLLLSLGFRECRVSVS